MYSVYGWIFDFTLNKFKIDLYETIKVPTSYMPCLGIVVITFWFMTWFMIHYRIYQHRIVTYLDEILSLHIDARCLWRHPASYTYARYKFTRPVPVNENVNLKLFITMTIKYALPLIPKSYYRYMWLAKPEILIEHDRPTRYIGHSVPSV